MALGGVLLLLSLGPGLASSRTPLVLVLCEHFDLVCPFYLDATSLRPAAAPTHIGAPHDAVFDARRNLLHVAATYKSQPCLVSYTVSPEGALRRSADPVPTSAAAPTLVRAGDGGAIIYACDRECTQIFRLDEKGFPGPAAGRLPGSDAMVAVDATRVVTLRRGRVQLHAVSSPDGSLTAVGGALDAGAGASSLALGDDGRTLYVLNLESFTRHVKAFEVCGDGLRASKVSVPLTREEAQKGLVATGASLYLVNASDTISTYLRAPDAVRPVGALVPTARGATDLQIRGRLAMGVGAGEPTIRLYRVAPADGRLRPTTPVMLPEGAAGTRLLILE